ncbi:MAG: hypothetical protein WCF03_19590 [Nitrososphaeraceae archaeon]
MSLIESMRSDPDKYGHLIYNNGPSNADCGIHSQDYIAMLIEEAEKLYNKLAKELLVTSSS